jgi:hypothetical protein
MRFGRYIGLLFLVSQMQRTQVEALHPTQTPESTMSIIQSSVRNPSQSPVAGHTRSKRSVKQTFESFVSKITTFLFQTHPSTLEQAPLPEPTCTPPYTFASFAS